MIHIDFDFYLNVRNILLIILTFFMTIKIYSFVSSFRTDDADDIACTRKKTVAIITFCAIGILLTVNCSVSELQIKGV